MKERTRGDDDKMFVAPTRPAYPGTSSFEQEKIGGETLSSRGRRTCRHHHHQTTPRAVSEKVSSNSDVQSSNTSTAKIIETVASNILKFNLKKQSSVCVSVDSNDFETLTQGKVRRVQIKGTNWSSRKNLTCESLDIQIGKVGVDYAKIVTAGRIEIRKPGGRGNAKLFMSFEDFANFLKHPLTNEALNKVKMTFEDEAPKRGGDEASLVLKATFDEDRNTVRSFQMRPLGEERVDVYDVSGSNSDTEQSERVKRFFETLELDLMGTKLQYRNMRVLANGVALDLNVLVEKFPPPVIDF